VLNKNEEFCELQKPFQSSIGHFQLTLLFFDPHDQVSHQNQLTIEPVGAFFVSMLNNEVIHWTLLVFIVLQGLQ